jgi:vacuolar-type H+-ATPase subunit H
MAKIQEPVESTVNNMESIIQEYREKLWQALETDCNNLKEKAEQDSQQIVDRAKEEAEEIVAQAKQEARVEAEQILAKAKEETEQTLREVRESAAKNRQESARVIGESKEKAAQMVAEIIEIGIERVQNKLTQTTSEIKTQLLNQLSQSIEQIMTETETNIMADLESLAETFAEAGNKLQQPDELPEKEVEINSQLSVLKEDKPKEVAQVVSISEQGGPPASSDEEQPSTPIKERDNTRLYKGCLKLEMIPPFNQERLEGVPKWLSQITGLKVISTGGRAGANRWITTFTIDLERPMPLLKILKAVPSIKNAAEREGNIVITLK